MYKIIAAQGKTRRPKPQIHTFNVGNVKKTTMTYHILNGDAIVKTFRQTNIEGQIIVCRECMVDGPLSGNTLQQFWETRAKYIAATYNETTDNYFNKVVSEFEKVISLPDNGEVCLWFENDLFCQTNMWFLLSLLATRQKKSKVFRVFPYIDKDDIWKGFGLSDTNMLEQSYADRTPFKPEDIELGKNLWDAYKNNDFDILTKLALTESNCFQYLSEVCKAHIDRHPSDGHLGRPNRIISEIINTKTTDFNEVFVEFTDREGIYGFGDSQVKKLYEREMHSR